MVKLMKAGARVLVAVLRNLLTPEASEKLRKGNYDRLFDETRRRVRAWEAANVK